MSAGSILTLGLGTFSDAHHVVTLGFLEAVSPTPPPVSAAGGGAGGQGRWRAAAANQRKRRRKREEADIAVVLLDPHVREFLS